MITVICGEDNIASRNYFHSLKQSFQKKDILVKELLAAEVFDIDKWMSSSLGLFNDKIVFFSEDLNKKVSKRNPSQYEKITKIAEDKNIELIVWESCMSRDIKIKTIALVKEFKPSKNIFKLLDCLIPGNKKSFLIILGELLNKDNEFFIFQMIVKHIKTLILTKEGVSQPKLQSWQLAKLKQQTGLWKMENLILFYQSLYKIEVGLKTSTSPFSVGKSLSLLACYFL